MNDGTEPVREKPHRLPREFYVGEIFASFTMCIRGQRGFFTTADTVSPIVGILRQVCKSNRCAVPAYCFMPDHLHVIMEGRSEESDLWMAAVEFKQRSGYWMRSRGVGARWQKDFHDHIIRRYEDLKAHILYVLENPVRKDLVAEWGEYSFSGCVGYESLEAVLGLL